MEKIVVLGKIEIPKEIRGRKFNSYIKVLDTSYEDAPAITIAETRIDHSMSKLTKEPFIPFELSIDAEIIPSHDYTVSVLVDMDGDGIISKNDYIQNQSYNVISQGKPKKNIFIALQKV